MLYPLANIIMPEEKYKPFGSLFYTHFANKMYFNTWMNAFAAKKYNFYCELGTLYIKIEAKGAYRLEVVGNNRQEGCPNEDHVLVSQEVCDNACIAVPGAERYDSVFLTIIQDAENSAIIKGGCWCTDAKPLRENKMAVVSCTFKREDFITKNVARFEQFLKDTPEMQGRLKLVVVDNGQTLPETITSENVELYPNMNTGGAGGFTRGLMEVMNKNEGYTHVLFMDDDVEMITESFYRTLAISDHLKEEYKDSFVGGAMLDIERRNNMYEALAVHDGFFVRGLIQNLDVNHYENVMYSNRFSPDMFKPEAPFLSQGWWYCMFPISFAEKTGLPMPFFLRADDVEWSWRASALGTHFITLNGVFIWHAAFMWRVSKVTDYYYMQRNAFFMQVVHNPDFFRSFFKIHFNHTKEYILSTYDYSAIEIFIKALQDILRGSAIFRENPQIHCKILAELNNSNQWIDCSNEEELRMVAQRQTQPKNWRRNVYKWTKKGKYAPNFLRKKRAIALDWFPDPKTFQMTRSVKVYHLGNKKYSIRKYDAKRLQQYRKQMDDLINQIDLRYDEISQDIRNAYDEFRTQDFWKKYLNLQ